MRDAILAGNIWQGGEGTPPAGQTKRWNQPVVRSR